MQDPWIVEQYNKFLAEEINWQELAQWLEGLVKQVTGKWLTRANQRILEDIDQAATAAKLVAEQHFHKLKIGKVPWSPSLTKVITMILYWKGIRKCLQGGHIQAKFLWCLVNKGGATHSQDHIALNREGWQLLNQNNAKQQVCKAKAQKRVDQALELKSQQQQKRMNNVLKNCTSWSPGGSWWTKLHCVVHP